MSAWDDLARELDAWARSGRIAEFWWRDDDAVGPSAALDRLLALARRHQAPLALAVIPAPAEPALAERLAGEPGVAILQHGWAHLNHAPPGEPKAELGPHRPAAYVVGELARGQMALDRAMGPGWLKVLVPPYNRIAPAVAAALPQAGYVGLSTYGARGDRPASVPRINAHVDIMDWTTRAFLGAGPALGLAIGHLEAKREGRADRREPTGLLTHHRVHDEAAWSFADGFLACLGAHPAARVADPRALFAAGQPP